MRCLTCPHKIIVGHMNRRCLLTDKKVAFRNFIGFELDADYYKASKQRLEDFMAQPKIEDMFSEIPERVQIGKGW